MPKHELWSKLDAELLDMGIRPPPLRKGRRPKSKPGLPAVFMPALEDYPDELLYRLAAATNPLGSVDRWHHVRTVAWMARGEPKGS